MIPTFQELRTLPAPDCAVWRPRGGSDTLTYIPAAAAAAKSVSDINKVPVDCQLSLMTAQPLKSFPGSSAVPQDVQVLCPPETTPPVQAAQGICMLVGSNPPLPTFFLELNTINIIILSFVNTFMS